MSDEEWEIVANPARVKRDARKEKRAQEEQDEHADRRKEISEEEMAMRLYDARKRELAKSSSSSQPEVPRVATQYVVKAYSIFLHTPPT